MSTRRRSMTATSLSPARTTIHGWDSGVESYARDLQEKFARLERRCTRKILRLKRKIKYAHAASCILGIVVGSLGAASTLYEGGPPVWIKAMEVIFGYLISALSYSMSSSKMSTKLETITKALVTCIYNKNSLMLVTHLPREERPDAVNFLKKILSDLESIEGYNISPGRIEEPLETEV